MKTPILGSAYVARSVNAADNRMVNIFPEIIPEGGKEPAFLQRCPGLQTATGVSVGAGPIRGFFQTTNSTGDNLVLAVSGSTLYRTSGYGTAWTSVGSVLGGGTMSTIVSFTEGPGYVVVSSGSDMTQSYVFDTATYALTQITDPSFIGAFNNAYIDGFYIFAGKSGVNRQTIYCSAPLDPFSYDAADFASAESLPDSIVGIATLDRELWVFGSNSIEVWYNAGLPNFPFAPNKSAFMEVGCDSRFSIAKLDNSLFWLGRDNRGKGIIYRTNGYRAERISTHAVEWRLRQINDISDAVAYTYQMDGHGFYVISFTDGDLTLVYDVSTQAWHERAAYDSGTDTFSRHRSQCYLFMSDTSRNNDYHVVSDYNYSGAYYVLNPDQYYDDYPYPSTSSIKALRSWRALPTGENNLKRTAQHSLTLDAHSDYEGGDSTVSLRWSDDGGNTWSNPKTIVVTGNGRYNWHRLGMTMQLRDRVYEISTTDSSSLYLMGAEIEVSPTNA